MCVVAHGIPFDEKYNEGMNKQVSIHVDDVCERIRQNDLVCPSGIHVVRWNAMLRSAIELNRITKNGQCVDPYEYQDFLIINNALVKRVD